MTICQGTEKLWTQLQIKDQTKFEKRIDLVYREKRTENDWQEIYLGKSDKWMSERITDHNKIDKNLYLLQHAFNKKYKHI